MIVEQFYDKGLSHGSYAIISGGQMAVIDPARDPKPYLDFAIKNRAKITAIIETHPHADFVSSHLELHQKTEATIYVSRLVGADYPHTSFDDGDLIQLGKVTLKAINTPGHSPDSICILLLDESANEYALFTGDTLFVGDVGRPDLRENVGNVTAKKEELARAMYHSTRNKLMTLPEQVLVYPAHGPGSLCGKSMSHDLYSTIGKELRSNYALQLMDELTFVKKLTEDQPFIPKYFGYDVALNKKGASALKESVDAVPIIKDYSEIDKNIIIIDTRPQNKFKAGHLNNAFNLQNGAKFETWLGSIVLPKELFYLVADDEATLHHLIYKTAKIGYENQIKGAFVPTTQMIDKTPVFDMNEFIANPDLFTIVDVRNDSEVKEGKIFPSAITIPLPELRERINEIPTDKPIVVHCAAGYRSAAGASIIEQQIKNVPILDMSEGINKFSVKK